MLGMQKTEKKLSCPEMFSGKRVLIVGLGKTGMACVRFLYARGVEFAVTDSRVEPPALQEMKENYPDVAIFLEGFDKQVINSSDVLIVSPGIAITDPALLASNKHPEDIIGDIEVFSHCVREPVIGITGSNGKSTVTTLLGEMARLSNKNVKVGGNIGTPVLDLIQETSEADLYVLELSSFQLETTYSLNLAASVILNVSEDHMDRYSTVEEYARAKERIYRGTGIAIVNMDDPKLASLGETILKDRSIYLFTLNKPGTETTFGLIKHKNEQWLAKGKQALLPVSAIKIQGKHNVANVLATLALGTAIDLPVPAMLEAIQTFPGLAHRTQWVAEIAGVQWYNDSKATNVGASIAAIEGLSANKLVVILGGQGKGQDFSPLKPVLEKSARHIILMGQDATLIAEAMQDVVPCTFVSDMPEAVLKSKGLAQQGDAVLLSPACASFDMFDGYDQRGNVFMQLVEEVAR